MKFSTLSPHFTRIERADHVQLPAGDTKGQTWQATAEFHLLQLPVSCGHLLT